jgi:hypothetical protein
MPDPRREFTPASKEELDQLAAIQVPADVERAKRAWKQDASPKARELLDATPADESPPPGR